MEVSVSRWLYQSFNYIWYVHICAVATWAAITFIICSYFGNETGSTCCWMMSEQISLSASLITVIHYAASLSSAHTSFCIYEREGKQNFPKQSRQINRWQENYTSLILRWNVPWSIYRFWEMFLSFSVIVHEFISSFKGKLREKLSFIHHYTNNITSLFLSIPIKPMRCVGRKGAHYKTLQFVSGWSADGHNVTLTSSGWFK